MECDIVGVVLFIIAMGMIYLLLGLLIQGVSERFDDYPILATLLWPIVCLIGLVIGLCKGCVSLGNEITSLSKSVTKHRGCKREKYKESKKNSKL